MRMKALKAHRYGNVQRKPGDEFEVRKTDLRLMKALGWQAEAPEPEPPKPEPVKRAYVRRDVVVEPEVTAEEEVKPRRATYRRRDLTAES